ncbi:MAG: hypothetical protein IK038_07955 [Bacteroidaceae bacterium]|nr:hypothetical protein [Bacteroidaceae bacterium]
MNTDVLNMNRFGRYLVTDIKNAIARYGVSLLVMATISLTAYLLVGFFTMIVGGGWHSLGEAGRLFFMGISFVVLTITAPAKIYGFITDKKEGSSYLMVPASSLEKTISMILVCCVILPLAFFAVYLSLDQIVCLIDGNCGESLLAAISNGQNILTDAFHKISLESENVIPDYSSLACPWMYLDDIAQGFLVFLVGALIFKSSKPAKTVGCLILLSIVLSMITTPIIMHGAIERFKDAAAMENMTPEELFQSFPFLAWSMKHAVLLDFLSDTIVNIGLAIAIYFRVRKIKH